MKIVFVSNYYNHHQSSFSEEMYKITDGNYYFIETQPVEDERKELGWNTINNDSFVIKSYLNNDFYKNCMEIIDKADVVIFGSAPYRMIKNRLKKKKIVIFYSERIYKRGLKKYTIPLRYFKFYLIYGRYYNTYMLCSSAYTAADYAITHTFVNKTYKWGYFPKFIEYDIDKIINTKENSLLWCGRFIDWKHPEIAVELVSKLIKAGYSCKLNMIGTGPLKSKIENMVKKNKLEKYINILGAMPPENVRKIMEKSRIFIFTSDFNEGWGAVLNESMNSACSVVVSHAIGSAPFLIQNDINGLLYENGNYKELFEKVKGLIENNEKAKIIGKNAYLTIKRNWTANIAAERLIHFANELIKKGESNLYSEGLCSKAEILKNDWIKK